MAVRFTAGAAMQRFHLARQYDQQFGRQQYTDPDIPDDTRLWAALQAVGGGTWGGCVYDVDAVLAALRK